MLLSDASGVQVADLSVTFEVKDESVLPLFISEPGYSVKREEIAVDYSGSYKTNKVDPETKDVIYKVEDITDPQTQFFLDKTMKQTKKLFQKQILLKY